jgi:hypothetical protein
VKDRDNKKTLFYVIFVFLCALCVVFLLVAISGAPAATLTPLHSIKRPRHEADIRTAAWADAAIFVMFEPTLTNGDIAVR